MSHVTETGDGPSRKPDWGTAHRAGLRASGLRPRQIWLPDLRDAKVRAEIRADAAALAAQAHRWNDLIDDVEALNS